MGCDTYITLPPETRVGDVAKVMAALAGFEKTKDPLQETFVTKVEGWKIEQTPGLYETVSLHLKGDMLDGDNAHMCFYHMEGDRYGNRIVSASSTPFWIAVGHGLLKFFGGGIDYNDCEGTGPDLEMDRPRECNAAEDGQEWTDFQQDIFDIQPVTKQDILDAAEHAAYTEFDYLAQFNEELGVPVTEELAESLMGETDETDT